jgi:guanylate kinase
MRLVVLTAPSGAGKTTIARHLLETVPGMRFSISATTRPAREGEKDGVDYYFLTAADFERLKREGAFVEYEEVYPGLLYGTLKSELEAGTSEAPVLLDIDVKGALNVKKRYGDSAYVVFLKAPSLTELERRLKRRATDSAHSVEERLRRAREELTFERLFDHIIVNDNLDDAISETILQVKEFLSATSENSHERQQNQDQVP